MTEGGLREGQRGDYGKDGWETAGRTDGVLRESILRARPPFLPTRHHTSVVASSTPVIPILNAPSVILRFP